MSNAASPKPSLLGDKGRWYIIDSTLREGQQNATCEFNINQKRQLLVLLDRFGIEYAELWNPISSDKAFYEYEDLLKFKRYLNLNIKLIVHVRNNILDITKALSSKYLPDGVSLVISTSNVLRDVSHKLHVDDIIHLSVSNLQYIKNTDPNIQIRFSTEDSFRSNIQDLCTIFTQVQNHVDRIGIADTLGFATHIQVEELVKNIKQQIHHDLDIECHFHNDSASAVYNAFIALLSGCTHINTSVLGLGERNGITDLTGFVSRLYTYDTTCLQKYNLKYLKLVDEFVANAIKHPIPFNNPITGMFAFSHKAGIHTNAMLKDVESYQILDPSDFDLSPNIIVFSPIMGYNALSHFMLQNSIYNTHTIDKIKFACHTLKNMMYSNPNLQYKLNTNTEFAISLVQTILSPN